MTRDSILEEALQIIRFDGLEMLSMRELAAGLGVRASSLYRHFPSRVELEVGLAERASRELEQRLQGAFFGRTPSERLRAAAWEYLRFAREDFALFTLLTASPNNDPRLHDVFLRLAGGEEPRALALWSILHGYLILDQAGRFTDEAQSRLLEAVELLVPPATEPFASSRVDHS